MTAPLPPPDVGAHRDTAPPPQRLPVTPAATRTPVTPAATETPVGAYCTRCGEYNAESHDGKHLTCLGCGLEGQRSRWCAEHRSFQDRGLQSRCESWAANDPGVNDKPCRIVDAAVFWEDPA